MVNEAKEEKEHQKVPGAERAVGSMKVKAIAMFRHSCLCAFG